VRRGYRGTGHRYAITADIAHVGRAHNGAPNVHGSSSRSRPDRHVWARRRRPRPDECTPRIDVANPTDWTADWTGGMAPDDQGQRCRNDNASGGGGSRTPSTTRRWLGKRESLVLRQTGV